jgi:predicted acyltransferase
MIVVNSPGTWSHVYDPLLHANWHGMTLTDLVFPFFLFIVGVSITLAYTKRVEAGAPKGEIYKKIISRSIKIYLLGIFLWLWPEFDFGNIRYVGVLQRIAIVFLCCSLLFLHTNWKQQIVILSSILLGYWVILYAIPVPIDGVIQQALNTGMIERAGGTMVDIGEISKVSGGFIAPNVEPGINFAAWIDRQLVPGYFYERTWDPEGLLSTLPAIGTCILGMISGKLILSEKETYQKLTWIFFAGFAVFIIGMMWSWFFPLNKNLWSSSYVMASGGLAMMFLGAFLLIVDVLEYKKWTRPGIVFGANAITSYVLSGMLLTVFYNDLFGIQPLNQLFLELATGIGVPLKLGSFMYALIYTSILYIPAVILYRKKIFIKV